jgi:glycogen debranching enzyme
MPDKWEYPWYAAWDLAFHCVAIAEIDPDFAKEQLVLMTREWYMHPNGQIPAYEWAFGDVNPPVHAWAAYQVYLTDKKLNGKGDRQFLERVFHKLLLNFTWWVNRKDVEGQNVFQGGFLGLDNIGVFDRSATLPTGGHIEQSDGTSWMAMYSLDMLAIALELANDDPVYEDVASKFWEHFIYIAKAMNNVGEDMSLWNEEDGFFYDVLHLPNGEHLPLRVRSMVGLIPLYACQTLEPELLDKMPTFKRRLEWFVENRPDLTENVACMMSGGRKERRLLAIPTEDQLRRILHIMLDEKEFLSPFGIRALSRLHAEHPFTLHLDGMTHSVDYQPGESNTSLFGGNSNWRGPIWMPVNYLLVRALRRFHDYYGDEFQVECPTGSGRFMNLMQVSMEVATRIANIFRRDGHGRRPVYAGSEKFQNDPHWRDHLRFHEYFHGDTGAGVGAAQQCGWTALVAKLIADISIGKQQSLKPIKAKRIAV